MVQLSFEKAKCHKLKEIPLDLIDVGDYMESHYRHLVNTIASLGVIQTVILKQVYERYEVIAGKRRVLAAKSAEIETVPAIVVDADISKTEIAYLTVAENMIRRPNPAAEVESFSYLQQEYGWDEKQLAQNLSIPVSHVRNRLRLLQLIPEMFERLRKGELKVTFAQKIAKLAKDKQQELLLEEKLTGDMVGKALREKTLGKLLSIDELFEVPKEASTLDQIKESLQRLISESENENRAKFEIALCTLQEVKL